MNNPMLKHFIYSILMCFLLLGDLNPIVAKGIYSGKGKLIFTAVFINAEGDTTKRDTFKLIKTKEKLFGSQNKIKWELKQNSFTKTESTGVIENDERIWIHPPRFENYVEFSEYSAFPEIRFPIKENDTWTSTLTLMDYETEESGPKVDVEYKVMSIDTLNKDTLNRKVKIIGKGTSGLGTYTNEYIYTDKLGFTEFIYTKTNGEKLIIRYVDELIMRGFIDH